MVFTFYSYKGGVGRSMALANVAKWLCGQGLRVVMVDWDLEAPGLESFFAPPGPAREEVRQQLGLIDTLVSYKRLFPRLQEPFEQATARAKRELKTDDPADPALQRRILLNKVAALEQSLPPLQTALHPIDTDVSGARGKGELLLLSAGWRGGDRFPAYAQAVQGFDWNGFYLAYEGQAYFDWMRQQLEKDDAIVLIDSRTGVTEMGGVSTRQMADVVLVFTAPNVQNLEGVGDMATSFQRDKLDRERGRTVQIVMVPTRIDNFNPTRINRFAASFETISAPFTPAVFHTLKTRFWDLRIPYTPDYAYDEHLAIGDPDADKDLEEAYKRLTAHLAVLASPQSSLRRALRVEIDRVFKGQLPSVLIMHADADRPFADAIRKRIVEANISVWPDPFKSAVNPADGRAAIDGLLDQSQYLVVTATPASLTSDDVRAAWRYARQVGVTVVPIASGESPHGVHVPGWMNAPTKAFDSEWPQIQSILSAPNAAARVPLMGPDLAPGWVDRSQEVDRLKALLIGPDAKPRVALFGPAGAGKSVVAICFARADEVEAEFADGIFWGVADEHVDLGAELSKMCAALTGDPAASALDPRTQLERRLAGKRCLMVIDAPNSEKRLLAFPLTIPGCRYLILTRDRSIALAADATTIQISPMQQAEATQLLQQSGVPAGISSSDLSRAIASAAGLPVALKTAAATLQNASLAPTGVSSWNDLVAANISPATIDTFKTDVLDRVSDVDRERLIDLAFASATRVLDVPALARLWNTEPGEALKTLTRASDLALLESTLDQKNVRLHPWFGQLIALAFPSRDVNRVCEAAFTELAPDQADTARQVLCRLVRIVDAPEGVATEGRAIALSDLTTQQAALVPQLRDLGLVTVVDDRARGGRVFFSEKSIPQRWTRLAEWVEKDQEFLRWRQRLGAYVADWQRTQDASALLTGTLLLEAQRWLGTRQLELSRTETAYVQESLRAHERAAAAATAAAAPPRPLPPAPAAERASGTRLGGWPLASGALIVVLLGALGVWTFSRPSGPTAVVPASVATSVDRGDIAAASGDLAGAIQDYSAALEQVKDDPSIYYKRGLVYSRSPDASAKALADFDEALKLDPRRPDVLRARGAQRLEGGDAKGAISDLDAAIALDNQSASAYYTRGMARARDGTIDGALADYAAAIRLQPTFRDAYFARSALFEARGQNDKAIADLRQVLAQKPDALTARAAQARLSRLGASYTPPSTSYDVTVYLHYQDPSDRAAADAVRKAIEAAGFKVAGTQLVPTTQARTSGDVRFAEQDQTVATRVRGIVEGALADIGYRLTIQPITLSAATGNAPIPGRLEVWIPPLSHPSSAK